MSNFSGERALRLNFKIDNTNFLLVVDSGASCCLLDKRHLTKNLNSYLDTSRIIEVSGVNGVTTTLGTIDTFTEYNGYMYPITFHIMDELPSNVIGLIGTNFLKKFGAKINFENSKMTLRIPRFEENFIIPPRTEVIAFVETCFSEQMVILNQEIQPQVYIAGAIVKPEKGKIPVRILNIKNKAVKVDNLKPQAKPLKNYDILEIDGASKYNVARTKELLSELKLTEIHDKDRPVIERLCIKYNDIFCLKDDKLTVTKIYQPSLTVKPDTHPVYTRPYKLPQAHKEEVQRQVDKMLSENIIENAISEWNSPLLLVPKKSAQDERKWRLVIDYRKLNNALQDDKFPLPNIEEVIESLAGAKYFSHLDLSQGYYQCELKPEDRPITAFGTSGGQYQMTRLPMGLKVSPSTFSRLMTVAMSGLNMERCLVYLDDIIVFGKTLEEHNRNLSDVFERLRKTNLKLNPQKCNFLKTELLYLGHLVSVEGVKPDPSKIEIIKQWSSPRSADEVKRFVAFANYYRKHIKDFAKLCSPLNKLTRKNEDFKWTEECERSFQYLKECFMNPPVLDYPNFSESNIFTLHTDASGKALGAVLSNQNTRPIAFASRALNKAELNYSTIENELLGVVWAIRHFRPYLYGRKFEIFTDHRPLVYLFTLNDPSSRLTKFRLALEEYKFDVIYKKGSENVVAGALSRISIEDLKALTPAGTAFICTRSQTAKQKIQSDTSVKIDTPNNYIEIKIGSMKKNEALEAQLEQGIICIDPNTTLTHLRGVMNRLVDLIKETKIKGLIVKNTIENKKLKDKIEVLDIKGMPPIIILGRNTRQIDDRNEQKIIINDFHVLPTAGHAGIRRTINTIKQRYHWKTLENDVVSFIKRCTHCQRNKSHYTKQPMQLTSTASQAFEKIFLDMVGPLLPDAEGNQYILTTQCDLTKFVTATPIMDKTTDAVAKAFVENVILNYGVPAQVLTDSGTEFMSTVFEKICKLLQVKKLNSTAYHHQTIGALENSHKVLGNFLRIQTNNSYGSWSAWIPFYKFAYNTTVHSATGKTPFELLFGRLCTLPSNLTGQYQTDPIYNIDDYTSILKYKLQVSQREARENLLKVKADRVSKYNQNAKDTNFTKGTLVLVKTEKGPKLETKYNGPYEILEDMGSNVKIAIKNNKDIDIVHKDRIREFSK